MTVTIPTTFPALPKASPEAQRPLYAQLRQQISELTGEDISTITARHQAEAIKERRNLWENDRGYAFLISAKWDLLMIPFRKVENISKAQEAWGDRSINVLFTPHGWTAEQHLAWVRRYKRENAKGGGSSSSDYEIRDDRVVETFFYSIGD